MSSQDRQNYFGKGVAERYDDSSSEMFDPAVIEPTVDFLAGLAGDGAALELGIGTGRVALPLFRRGVNVCGIDLSSAMVEQLRAKPGADRIQVTLGDFATTRVAGRVHARLPGLQHDQQPDHAGRQVACFQNAAAHLGPADASWSRSASLSSSGCLRARRCGRSRSLPRGSASTSTTSPARGWSRTTTGCEGDRFRSLSVPFRYVWPAELDLMARLAGMTLRERWSGWNREPFTSESRKHVSVWQKGT